MKPILPEEHSCLVYLLQAIQGAPKIGPKLIKLTRKMSKDHPFTISEKYDMCLKQLELSNDLLLDAKRIRREIL